MNVTLIDCHYIQKETAGVYLIKDKTSAALIETNTPACLPYVLEEMKKQNISAEQIKYIFVTHIHLDHSGGAPCFLEEFPNAKVVAHPMGVRYLKDPTRIIKGARAVYGDELYDKLYGDIPGISEEKIIAAEDYQEFTLDTDRLIALHTPGHASHHIAIHHPATRGVFSGDVFGVCYPGMNKNEKSVLLATTTPTEFNPNLAFESIDKIVSTSCDKIYLTHFGIWEDVSLGASMLKENLEFLNSAMRKAMKMEPEKIYSFLRDEIQKYFDSKIGTSLKKDEKSFLKLDLDLNAQGAAYYVKKMIKKGKTF